MAALFQWQLKWPKTREILPKIIPRQAPRNFCCCRYIFYLSFVYSLLLLLFNFSIRFLVGLSNWIRKEGFALRAGLGPRKKQQRDSSSLRLGARALHTEHSLRSRSTRALRIPFKRKRGIRPSGRPWIAKAPKVAFASTASNPFQHDTKR